MQERLSKLQVIIKDTIKHLRREPQEKQQFVSLNAKGKYKEEPIVQDNQVIMNILVETGERAHMSHLEATVWYEGAVHDNTENEKMGTGRHDGWPTAAKTISPESDGSWKLVIDLNKPDLREKVFKSFNSIAETPNPIPGNTSFTVSVNLYGEQHGKIARTLGSPGPITIMRQ